MTNPIIFTSLVSIEGSCYIVGSATTKDKAEELVQEEIQELGLRGFDIDDVIVESSNFEELQSGQIEITYLIEETELTKGE